MLIVLWTVVLLTLITTQLLAAGRTEVRLAGNLRDAAVARAAAEGAVFEAVSRAIDTSARHWAPDGAPHDIRLAQAVAEVRVTSENGRIDLNSAPADTLAALLRAVGVARGRADELALAIAEWRFPSSDADALRRAYRAAGRDYAPPQAAFQSVGELELVLGMDPGIVARLRPHVTVYHDGDPDLALADPVVRAVLTADGASPPIPSRDARAGQVLSIEVATRTASGARAGVHAVVRINADVDKTGWRVLAWE